MEGREKKLFIKKHIEQGLFFVIIILLISAFYIFFQKSGWRFDWSVQKINYLKYEHIAPDFSFRYPDYFQFDGDKEKKFGADYIAGFRLKTDQRTGCDLRFNSFGLNFSKSDQEIEDAIKNDLSKSVKEFNLIETKRIKFGGEDAFAVDFTFLDPIGNRTRLTQIMVSYNKANYLAICGTGEYQYKFFQKDFADFFESFQWGK